MWGDFFGFLLVRPCRYLKGINLICEKNINFSEGIHEYNKTSNAELLEQRIPQVFCAIVFVAATSLMVFSKNFLEITIYQFQRQ